MTRKGWSVRGFLAVLFRACAANSRRAQEKQQHQLLQEQHQHQQRSGANGAESGAVPLPELLHSLSLSAADGLYDQLDPMSRKAARLACRDLRSFIDASVRHNTITISEERLAAWQPGQIWPRCDELGVCISSSLTFSHDIRQLVLQPFTGLSAAAAGRIRGLAVVVSDDLSLRAYEKFEIAIADLLRLFPGLLRVDLGSSFSPFRNLPEWWQHQPQPQPAQQNGEAAALSPAHWQQKPLSDALVGLPNLAQLTMSVRSSTEPPLDMRQLLATLHRLPSLRTLRVHMQRCGEPGAYVATIHHLLRELPSWLTSLQLSDTWTEAQARLDEPWTGTESQAEERWPAAERTPIISFGLRSGRVWSVSLGSEWLAEGEGVEAAGPGLQGRLRLDFLLPSCDEPSRGQQQQQHHGKQEPLPLLQSELQSDLPLLPSPQQLVGVVLQRMRAEAEVGAEAEVDAATATAAACGVNGCSGASSGAEAYAARSSSSSSTAAAASRGGVRGYGGCGEDGSYRVLLLSRKFTPLVFHVVRRAVGAAGIGSGSRPSPRLRYIVLPASNRTLLMELEGPQVLAGVVRDLTGPQRPPEDAVAVAAGSQGPAARRLGPDGPDAAVVTVVTLPAPSWQVPARSVVDAWTGLPCGLMTAVFLDMLYEAMLAAWEEHICWAVRRGITPPDITWPSLLWLLEVWSKVLIKLSPETEMNLR